MVQYLCEILFNIRAFFNARSVWLNRPTQRASIGKRSFFMENGWIKLHRKALESEVWKDSTAFRVLMWCLLRANHTTGKLDTGKFVGAKDCRLAASTFYDALQRLKRLGIINIATKKATIKYSEITINKWHLYQSTDQLTDNQPTINRQSTDTIQEYKNKELRKETSKNVLEEITPEEREKAREKLEEIRAKVFS